jgi:hypothetical protein
MTTAATGALQPILGLTTFSKTGHKRGRIGVWEDLYKQSIFGSICWNKMATGVNLSF